MYTIMAFMDEFLVDSQPFNVILIAMVAAFVWLQFRRNDL
jgi:hypothetical protein